jgi:GntR family transcriptional regulator / MocR family aminotransferase
VHKAKLVTDWHTPFLGQATLAAFIEQGAFARHIRKARSVYAMRHELVTRIVARELDDLLELFPSDAGLHVAAVARRLTADHVASAVARAAEHGIAVEPLERFAVGPKPMAGVVIGYGGIQASAIMEGLQRLRSCFEGSA